MLNHLPRTSVKDVGCTLRIQPSGRREVPLEVVILMADYFQISTDYILRGIPEKEDNCLQEAVEILAAMDQKRRRAALEHLRIVEKYGM